MSTVIKTQAELGKLSTGEASLFLDNGSRVVKLTFRLYENTIYVDAAEIFRQGIPEVVIKYLQDKIAEKYKGYTVVAAN